jgi:hypothetical protein
MGLARDDDVIEDPNAEDSCGLSETGVQPQIGVARLRIAARPISFIFSRGRLARGGL